MNCFHYFQYRIETDTLAVSKGGKGKVSPKRNAGRGFLYQYQVGHDGGVDGGEGFEKLDHRDAHV